MGGGLAPDERRGLDLKGITIDSDAVARLAEKAITRVTIRDLWAAGYRPSSEQSLANAHFLHRELPIRFAHRVKQLQLLPFGLSDDPRIQEAAAVYSRLIMRIIRHPKPLTTDHEASFAELIREATPPFYSVPHHIGAALLDLSTHADDDAQRELQQRALDEQLDHFFSARIGQRFLFQHYIASREERRPTFSGIIQSDCSVVAVCEAAASEAVAAINASHGVSPNVTIIGDRELTFTFVPSHIFFVVEELTKNACKATADFHVESKELPPVRVIVAKGDHEVTIKVADEGGGIARSKLREKWSYRGSKLCSGRHTDGVVGLQRLGAAPPASPGLGLPMSRLYAKYFGGTLHLAPMEGFGTDTYVKLNRLGDENCENPPAAVSNAPGGTANRDEALKGEAGSASLFDAQARRVEKIRVDEKKMPSQKEQGIECRNVM
jgi:pyruvate dehydrogenase kinase 2/3/4|tara:strand:- start:204 stop:1514 length:1311 start_codon:yes stop_codon:yes gene_type:complete